MKKKERIISSISYALLLSLSLTACGESGSAGIPMQTSGDSGVSSTLSDTASNVFSESSVPTASEAPQGKGTRDNTPVCLSPAADGTLVYENGTSFIDASHVSDGYVLAKYVGDCPKVKLQITNGGGTTYTYNLVCDDYEAFPLSCGDGTYTIATYENVSGSSYVTALYQEIPVTISDPNSPFLYPNQYVNYDSSKKVVSLASDLVAPADTDLEAVTYIYDYVTKNISYDHEKAETVASGYTSDVDAILDYGSGICLDYAAVMCSMLRSQRIPTHLEVGYAGDVYHAWISVYITDIGWLNGLIEFDGTSWRLVDPTFAANSSESALKKFIGDGNNYTVKYVY